MKKSKDIFVRYLEWDNKELKYIDNTYTLDELNEYWNECIEANDNRYTPVSIKIQE